MPSWLVRATLCWSFAPVSVLAFYVVILPEALRRIYTCPTIGMVNALTWLSLVGAGASLLGIGLGAASLRSAFSSQTRTRKTLAAIGLLLSFLTLPAWYELAVMQDALSLFSPRQTATPHDSTGLALEYQQSTTFSIYKNFHLKIEADGKFSYQAGRGNQVAVNKSGTLDQRIVRSLVGTVNDVEFFTLDQSYSSVFAPMTPPHYTLTLSLDGAIKTISWNGSGTTSSRYGYHPLFEPLLNRVTWAKADNPRQLVS